jgi:ABC-type uncharacterized transport system auxiliary subunit
LRSAGASVRPQLLSRALAVAACAFVTTTLAACESTEHESTQLELQSRAAQAAEAAKERAAKQRVHRRAGHRRSHSKPPASGAAAQG